MKQTFTEQEVFNNLTTEGGMSITVKIEKREPTPLLDELARRFDKPFRDKFDRELINRWLNE